MNDPSDLFVAPDAHGEPTVWQDVPGHPERPRALLRRSQVPDVVLWALLTERLEVRP